MSATHSRLRRAWPASSRGGRFGACGRRRPPGVRSLLVNRESLTHPRLEPGNEALALGQQPSLRDHARAGAALDKLDQPRVLAADLIVELEELRHPLLGRVGGEEVVEDAPCPVRRDWEDRADRQVRPAGEDVDAGVRPDEVELADRELSVTAAAQLPELAPVRVAGDELVVVRRDVDQAGEARVRDWTVVALEEVLGGNLPVRGDLPVGAVVEDELVDVEGVPDPARNVTEHLSQGRTLVVEVDEAERPPTLEPHRRQRDVGEVDVLSLRARRGAQRAVQVVRPRVIGALERLPAPSLLDDDRTAVPADVDERTLGAVVGLDEDDRDLSSPAGNDVPRISQPPNVVPGRTEDRLFLTHEHRRVPIPVPGCRAVVHGASASPASRIAAVVTVSSPRPIVSCSACWATVNTARRLLSLAA